MKRYYYKAFIPVLLFFLFFPFKSFSQDSTYVNSFEDSPIKKGSWAMAFELGAFLWGQTGNQEIENYNILLKYHLSDRSSLRFNFAFNNSSKETNNYNSLSYDYKKYEFDANINLQYFLTQKKYAKPFLSAGPYYHRYYSKSENENNYYSIDADWDLGVMLTLGVEVLVYKNIGIIAEHILKGAVTKKYFDFYGTDCSSGVCTEKKYTNDNYSLKFRANSFRLGLSLYF
jgi:hypothetical protein